MLRDPSFEPFKITAVVGHADGEQQYYDSRFNPLGDMQGEIIGAACFQRNVTYLRELSSSAPDRKAEFIIENIVHANADPRLLHLALEIILRNA
ncbi:MAG: hypothetical protein ACOC41_04005 [Chitinivibrionales bacterium]